jgi:acetyltransferase-like isoleucine patch superfamily enzyme
MKTFKKLFRKIRKALTKVFRKKNQFEGESIQIGRHTYGWENIKLVWNTNATVMIGNFTSIAANLTIQLGGNHNVRWISTYPFGHLGTEIFGKPIEKHPMPSRGVIIGNDVWIGNNVTIMGGVKIGNGAVIAMNSHVVRDVGDYEIHGGNPAQKISDRFSLEIIEELNRLQWWEADDERVAKIKHLLTEIPTMESISEIRTILGN